VITVTTTVSPMTPVHEHVHQRAGQQQQERQCAKEVVTVFAQQKVRGDGAEYQEPDGVSRTPERRRAVLADLLNVCMVMIHQASKGPTARVRRVDPSSRLNTKTENRSGVVVPDSAAPITSNQKVHYPSCMPPM
jgi:hypothetical protein